MVTHLGEFLVCIAINSKQLGQEPNTLAYTMESWGEHDTEDCATLLIYWPHLLCFFIKIVYLNQKQSIGLGKQGWHSGESTHFLPMQYCFDFGPCHVWDDFVGGSHLALSVFLQFSFLLKNQHNFPNSNPTRIEELCEKQSKAIEANSALKCYICSFI